MRWVFVALIALNLLVFYLHTQQKPTPAPQVGPQTKGQIRLLGELDVAASSQLNATDDEVCAVFDGLENESAAQALRRELGALGVEASLLTVDARVGNDYWVHLPPLVSRQAAVRLLKDLQARNIDSYIIATGELANGISLGMFSKLEAAEALQRRMLDLDYVASLIELPRMHRSYQVVLRDANWRQLKGPLLAQVADGFPKLRVQQKSCDSIATSEMVN